MVPKLYGLLFSLLTVSSSVTPSFDLDFELPGDRWTFRNAKRLDEEDGICLRIKPSTKDIVRRFYAILPYFDKEHANAAFLHKFRGTVYGMSEGEDILDREAAFYAAILAPMVFLQQYRDTWCLLERFHRAMRLYQISHPTEKRSSLKLLQSLRSINLKIRSFIYEVAGGEAVTSTSIDPEDVYNHEKKDVKFFKELIKNLG
ncbi:uncharacterized protein LOC106135548 [Amyelois transitella]|uniref:uncharacterized protein LOC106135548 n=1 Tax=Amyelois transitella TaxID=680683 RepID=UPI00067D50C0|nr:uncharacterized protein LOC106135548 [Amyelois transitella]